MNQSVTSDTVSLSCQQSFANCLCTQGLVKIGEEKVNIVNHILVTMLSIVFFIWTRKDAPNFIKWSRILMKMFFITFRMPGQTKLTFVQILLIYRYLLIYIIHGTKTLHKRFYTNVEIFKTGIKPSPICVFCDKEEDSVQHKLITCTVSNSISDWKLDSKSWPFKIHYFYWKENISRVRESNMSYKHTIDGVV